MASFFQRELPEKGPGVPRLRCAVRTSTVGSNSFLFLCDIVIEWGGERRRGVRQKGPSPRDAAVGRFSIANVDPPVPIRWGVRSNRVISRASFLFASSYTHPHARVVATCVSPPRASRRPLDELQHQGGQRAPLGARAGEGAPHQRRQPPPALQRLGLPVIARDGVDTHFEYSSLELHGNL